MTTGGTHRPVPDRLRRDQPPETYSGTSVLTVLSFDLGPAALGDGRPVVLAADGETVYSTGPSLYVASDQRWKPRAPGVAVKPANAGPGPDPAVQVRHVGGAAGLRGRRQQSRAT